jgi:hypothetical protein
MVVFFSATSYEKRTTNFGASKTNIRPFLFFQGLKEYDPVYDEI